VPALLDTLAGLRAGSLTPDGAIRDSLERIAARDGEIGAFVHLDRDARAMQDGPLAGIAVGVKDIIDTADMPTTMGSPLYAGWRPRADAAIVSVLKRAGATIVGKTTTTPFAFLDPTATRNPVDPAHTPGGSSAGSAAAVGSGMVPLTIGTQTGGSIIRPASYCGCAAIKPSFRLIPTVGVKTYSWTLDTIGLFATGVADVAAALEMLVGRPMTGGSQRPPRLGLLVQDFAGSAEPDAAAALLTGAEACRRAGASVDELAMPGAIAEAWAAHPVIQAYESRHALDWEYRTNRDGLPPLLGRELDAAQSVSADAYDDARRIARRARTAFAEAVRPLDAILTYAAPGAAPRGYASTGEARFNRLWTLLGVPCVNVPGLFDGRGLPIGLQIVAPFARDAEALAAARFVETAIRN
jgi:Asp-tRNA(Asn)/Glu-tRNA(Gln) amidotransferase A subunit family amidase